MRLYISMSSKNATCYQTEKTTNLHFFANAFARDIFRSIQTISEALR